MPGKNTKGGKKHKRNKNTTSDTKALRYKEEGQEYAKVTKCKGNCRFDVLCCDGKTRASVLCGGMRKRKFINQGQLVLVSIREWQDNICDIIDSYEESHAKRLKSEKEIPESFILGEENHYDSEDNIEFETGLPDDESDESEEVSEDEIDLEDI
jgi:translation initiation factor 1A|tara:strand:- start:786 stop:1247 length:462 start_codon:yes stop_codon:yes gene_type:complete